MTVVFSIARPMITHAATTPSLGQAATYGILANTYTNSAAGTTVNGDVGFLVAPTVEPAPVGGHTNYGSGATYTTAGADQATALNAGLNIQGCTFTWVGAVDLFLDSAHGTAGTYAPGVYCSPGAFTQTGSITLSGAGTYIFRSVGAYTTTAGVSILMSGGASACDVFWTPHATTFGAGTNFVGTLIDNDAVTSGAGTNILGRILAFNGPVTTATTTINLPSCVPPPATLHVIKQVVNDSGGSAVASSFTMHVKLSGTDVAGSPAAGTGTPGTSYSLVAGTYVVSENTNAFYTQSFSGDCNSSGSLILASGDDKTCTITNNDRPASITVVKNVVNDNGGTKVVADFPLFVGGTLVTSGIANTFNAPASYAISETADPGYARTFSGNCDLSGNLSVTPGDAKTCTITNNDIAPTLHIIKTVINDNGGTAVASSANIHVKNSGLDVTGSPQAGAGSPGTAYSLNAGIYAVSENALPGYSATFSGDCDLSGNITLASGADMTCTITNNDIQATLHVIKQVVNDSGGSAVASSFSLHVKLSGTDIAGSPAPGATAPGISYSLNAATYVVSEAVNVAYTQSFSGDCDSSGNVILTSGNDKVCTITNNDISPTLHVIKVVVNDNGGTAVASSANIHVKNSGLDVTGSPQAGAGAPGTSYTLDASSYVVSENVFAGYSITYSGACDVSGNVTLALADNKTCTVTNNDVPASITVIKTVINDNGGTKLIDDFPLFVGATPVTSGVANNFNAPASYAISETTDPGYARSFSGDCDSSGNLSVSPGDTTTCTITNNDISPVLHIIKVVVNNSGGSATASSFNLHVKLSGSDVTGSPTAGAGAPGTPYSLNAATYLVSEDVNASYAQSFSGNCDSSGSLTLTVGDNKTCTITNDDIAVIPPVPVTPPDPEGPIAISAPSGVPKLPNTGIGPKIKSSTTLVTLQAGVGLVLSLYYIVRKKRVL